MSMSCVGAAGMNYRGVLGIVGLRCVATAWLLAAMSGCVDDGSTQLFNNDDDAQVGTGTGTGGASVLPSGNNPIDDANDAACNPFAQDCPAGQKCMPYSQDGDQTWNALRCSPVAPDPKSLGDDCSVVENAVSGEDDCGVGLMCWNVAQGQTQGVCAELCSGSQGSPRCGADTVCAIYNDAKLPICLATCNPLAQTCSVGMTCIPQGGGSRFVCAFDASNGGGQFADPCLAFNKCAPGLYCAPAAVVPGCSTTDSCCTEFCDLSEANPSATCSGAALGQLCVPWAGEEQLPGLESLGTCAVPN